jgi:hypothetical protein
MDISLDLSIRFVHGLLSVNGCSGLRRVGSFSGSNPRSRGQALFFSCGLHAAIMSRQMSIDAIVPQLERVVGDDQARPGFDSFFSYRHAAEIHALGLVHEFSPDESRYLQVCISVVATTAISHRIWVRILWSFSKAEYPIEDCPSWEFPLSDIGVRSFETQWPSIRQRMGDAVVRRSPPENA